MFRILSVIKAMVIVGKFISPFIGFVALIISIMVTGA